MICVMMLICPGRYAKFVYDAWTHPETLRIISSIAGVDLVPVMDYEIGHVNISVNDSPDGTLQAAPVVDWHKDSYPFVCVIMLSDANEMVGGETALRTGSGEIKKVRGLQMVNPAHDTRPTETLIHIRVLLLSSKVDTSIISLFLPRTAVNASLW
jgi:hypothetical protein